jgi:hypothetical protein
MNMTSSPVLAANESREYRCPLTTSYKANGGAVEPSGSIVDVVAMRSCLIKPVRGKMPHVVGWVK